MVTIEPRQPVIDESLLQDCDDDLPLPPGATPPQTGLTISHDKAALRDCRKQKAALNAAVRESATFTTGGEF